MKERELFEITYLPLHISLLALEDAKLPKYLGSTLRGILGQALYKTNREVYKFLYKNGKQCKDKAIYHNSTSSLWNRVIREKRRRIKF